MIDPCIDVMDSTNINNNSEIVNAVKDSIKSPSVWNKLVKTIQNSNIDVDKLIEDSIEYGLDVGLFQQSREGKVVTLELLNSVSTTNSDQPTSPRKSKAGKQSYSSNIRLRPLSQSESGSLSCSSTALSSTIQTRRSVSNRELKRPLKMSQNIRRMKRRRYEKVTPFINERKPIRLAKDRGQRSPRVKIHNREMARAVPICAYCLGDELLNKRTRLQENMILCWDCGACAHPTCLRWPPTLLETVRNIRWQCLQCKCCSYCGNVSKKDDDMLLCDACDQGFHMYCFNPPIKTTPKGEWICRLCRPLSNQREVATYFSEDDFNFYPNCQIVTSENVYDLCSNRKKLPNPIKTSKMKKYLIKSRAKIGGKRHANMSLLLMKKKKLLERAVLRQKTALTDGLSMFFTPGDKRQSRVSKQSLTANSLNDLTDHKSPTSSVKERSSVRSVMSRTLSKSPNLLDKEESQKRKTNSIKSVKEEANTKKKRLSEISNCESSTESISVDMKKKIHVKHSMESSPFICNENTKKRGRKPKKQVTIELKTGSVADASIAESSSVTLSRLDQSTSQSAMSNDITETDPYPISDLDRQWYAEIQEKVAALLPPPMDAPPQLHSLNKTSRHRTEHSEPPELSMEAVPKDSVNEHINPSGDTVSNTNQKFPPRIQIGKYVIDTWYSAPYPSEYARLNVLYICEYCLKHIKSYDVYVMHMEKCSQHFPPGNEIYRNGDISVFEVDGYVSKLYCQQLCLLAKLFLDHKTLYYDVEPFLFYVSVLSKNQSCHIIGYFSKEKRSTHKYNLSCIMVLPPYQKFNYGRFLIDFSYLLSRKEGQSGSPEKPLSTLGRLSYESYWKSKVIPYLLNREDVSVEFYRHVRFSKPPKGLSITIDKISTETGINPHDVASTIQMLSKTVDLDELDRITIQLDWDKIKSESEKYATRYSKWIPLDAGCLRWSPLMQSNDKSQSSINQITPTVSPQAKQTKSIDNEKNTKSRKSPKLTKTLKTPIKKTLQSLRPKITKELRLDTETNIIPNGNGKFQSQSSKTLNKEEKKLDLIEAGISPKLKSSPKLKDSPKLKGEVNERTIVTRNKGLRQCSLDELQIVTRNRSTTKNLIIASPRQEISPINVDLTCSDNSDNQENDDCLVITAPISTRLTDWRKSKPVLERFKDTIVGLDDLDNSSSKPSPPININEPSPVSSGHNNIICPTLVSPEIDLEEETETDLILSSTRRPLIILEKCDEQNNLFEPTTLTSINNIDVIDLSSDHDLPIDTIEPIFSPFIDLSCRELNITASDSNTSKSSTPENHSTDELEVVRDNSPESSLVNIEFVLPNCVKESRDMAPTLSRVSSLEDSNSVGNHDSSSNSLQLPSDISLNEEFKRFYNDGNVFNSIGTSQTDSSDKDADESLLSVSNSDLELNGVYSCDSSICCGQKNNLPGSIKLGDEHHLLDDHIRCSPGQSDLVQSHVSSTTPFITPSTVWNVSIKSLSVTNINEVDLTRSRCNTIKLVDEMIVDDGYEDPFVIDEDEDLMDIRRIVVKDIVSSSLGEGLSGSCGHDELVVSSMEAVSVLDNNDGCTVLSPTTL